MTDKPPQSPILAEYVDVPGLAKELNKTPRTIFRWRAERKGPAGTWIGGKLYFHKSTIRKWLEAHEEAQPA